MLKKILSQDICGKCRICCSFVEGDVFEAPVFENSAMEYIKSIKPDVEFDEIYLDNEKKYRARYEFENSSQIKLCPALNESTGCMLSECNKPYECKLWPVRIFEGDDGIDVGISTMCSYLCKDDCSEVKKILAEGLEERILSDIDRYHLKPQKDNTGYKILRKGLH